MTKKMLVAAFGALIAAATFVPFESEGQAAQSGVMICRTKVNGVYQGNSCSLVSPSAPCKEITVCDGCGCWDTSSMIDPGSVPPTVVGTKKEAEKYKDEKKKP